jgi:hypothetical protein
LDAILLDIPLERLVDELLLDAMDGCKQLSIRSNARFHWLLHFAKSNQIICFM